MSDNKQDNPQDKQPVKNTSTAPIGDHDFKGADVDDRVWLFWERNKVAILAGVVAAFATVIGMQGARFYRESSEQRLQNAYLDAVENDTVEMFAIDYPNSPLAGYTWLMEADEAFAEEDYERAAKFYREASEGLSDLPLGARAQIGYGMTLYLQGNTSSARNALAAVTTGESTLNAQKAEAHYLLAEIALTLNETDKATKHLDAIAALSYVGMWNMRAEMLRMSAPELTQVNAMKDDTPENP